MNQTPIFTKLFSTIDSIVCGLVECRDEKNKLYILTAGYIGNKILLKLNTEDYAAVYRFEFTSPRQAMQKAEWIIGERKLSVKVATYYYNPTTNITSDFYRDNQLLYTFDARSRSSEPIKVSYKLHISDPDYQELCDNYSGFLEILRQNDRKLSIVEVSNPYKVLRRSKLLDLLAD